MSVEKSQKMGNIYGTWEMKHGAKSAVIKKKIKTNH